MSRLGATLAFLAVPALAAAQGAPLTLAHALEMAGRQNPEVLAARERAAAQHRRTEAVARSVWRRLSLSSSWSRSDTPSTVFAQKLNSGGFTQEDFAIALLNAPGALSHRTTVAALELPVDAFGRIRAQERGQAATGRVSDAQASEAVQEIRLRVVEAYLLSLGLGHWVHPGFFLFTAFVGANLLQSGFTNACPAMWIFRKLGLKGAPGAGRQEAHG